VMGICQFLVSKLFKILKIEGEGFDVDESY
jgi:hypothetical protein